MLQRKKLPFFSSLFRILSYAIYVKQYKYLCPCLNSKLTEAENKLLWLVCHFFPSLKYAISDAYHFHVPFPSFRHPSLMTGAPFSMISPLPYFYIFPGSYPYSPSQRKPSHGYGSYANTYCLYASKHIVKST